MEDFEFRERNLYSPEGRKDAIDSGAITAEDDGFMAGFNEDSEEQPEEEEPDYEKEWDNQPEDDGE
jgi:hypothetical protein